MKRSGPPQRKTPLRSTGGPKAKKWPPEGSRERRVRKMSRGKMPDSVTEEIRRRSGGRCEFGPHRDCPGTGEQLHHRKLRSAGGRHTADNLVDVCRTAHHDLIHANPGWAKRHGWIVPSWAEPEDVPFYTGCSLDCPVDHVAELS